MYVWCILVNDKYKGIYSDKYVALQDIYSRYSNYTENWDVKSEVKTHIVWYNDSQNTSIQLKQVETNRMIN